MAARDQHQPELAGDGDVRDDGPLAVLNECHPPPVQPVVAFVHADTAAAAAAFQRACIVAPGTR